MNCCSGENSCRTSDAEPGWGYARLKMAGIVLGIDVGGTKTAAGVVSHAGHVLGRAEIATRPEDPPEVAAARMMELCRAAAAHGGIALEAVTSAGLGVPGPSDVRAGVLVSPPNLPAWWGFPLGPKLSELLGMPVIMENDANAAAVAEHRFGAGRGVSNLVYLTISTGVGSGVIADGRLYVGQGFATEIGHSTVDLRGRACRCGGRGCLEALASGTALAEIALERMAAGEASSLSTFGDAVSAHHVVDAVRAGDPLAASIWDDAMEALSAGLANVINIFNPELIVLGGGVTRAGPLMFDALVTRTPKRALSPLASMTRIVPAGLRADVGILGAASMALFGR